MRIQQLEYLIKIIETGNITQAAKELFISQPSLSNAIKDLEKEMNIIIFNRGQKGVNLTKDGEEFLQYAKQIMAQINLVNHRYKEELRPKKIFSVSGQHYAFVVDAFVKLLNKLNKDDYQASLKELRTYEVIEDIANLKSEIGVIYKSNYNRKVIESILKEKSLTFTSLHKTKPYVFIQSNHPLSNKKTINLDDLIPYPKFAYDQGTHNSFYYWEEILADISSPKTVIVSDRATLFNLLIGLNGYTISSGIINSDLNGDNIIAIPLNSDEVIELGYITNDMHSLSEIGQEYLDILNQSIKEHTK
ncbi:MAG: LysR family transcriptional regulator [Gemella sp.]|nr:LysR family transcriptional regulator [Gemella sp.]